MQIRCLSPFYEFEIKKKCNDTGFSCFLILYIGQRPHYKKTPLLTLSKQMRLKNAISELEYVQQPEKNDKLNSFPQ